ncbi:MAG: hypothetical protein DME45_02525 [Verrucomicrobia bacterium]|nr:MAG: hypothetical protein DME45_02525 [Verrucomicrobiota bacterium]
MPKGMRVQVPPRALFPKQNGEVTGRRSSAGSFFRAFTDSLPEKVQRRLDRAFASKAFESISSPRCARSQFLFLTF